MNFLRILLFTGMCSPLLMSQQTISKGIFLQDVFREDFNEPNSHFPIEVKLGGKYAIIVDSLGYYGLGSGKSEYPVLIGWKNDLINFELKSSIRLKDEEDWESIQKLQGKTGQIIGIILKYNPSNQEALIFQINGVRQYRLSHLKNEKMRSLTGDWRNSENLKRDDKNEIIIRTKQ